jgi:hypothetical protein
MDHHHHQGVGDNSYYMREFFYTDYKISDLYMNPVPPDAVKLIIDRVNTTICMMVSTRVGDFPIYQILDTRPLRITLLRL